MSREPGVRTDTDGGSQGGEAGLAHVVVLMLENRSFDHMFGFLTHPRIAPLTPGSFVNHLDPDDATTAEAGVSDDGSYSLPVDPPHSHLSVMRQLHGKRSPKMDGFMAAYFEKASGKEPVPIVHWWRLEGLLIAVAISLAALVGLAPFRWVIAVALGIPIVGAGTFLALRLRRVISIRPWVMGAILALGAAVTLLAGTLGRRLLTAFVVFGSLVTLGTTAVLWFRSQPRSRRPPASTDLAELSKSIMRCQPNDNIPVLGALARAFAVCTSWYCSVPGETWPNRNFAHSATSDDATGIQIGFYDSRTIFEVLEAAGCSWHVYHQGMAQVMVFHELWEEEGRARNWFDFAEFDRHVSGDELPTYSFIEPRHGGAFSNSQHPGNNFAPQADGIYDFERGEALIASTYESLRQHSGIFEKTLLLITYDEHGGLFDRSPPPTDAAAPTRAKALISWTRRFVSVFVTYRGGRFDFHTLGPRVPTIAVSPWVVKGHLDTTRYDHSSIVATLRTHFAPRSSPLTRRDGSAKTFDHLVQGLSQPRDSHSFPDLSEKASRLTPSSVAMEAVGTGTGGPATDEAREPDLLAVQLQGLAQRVDRRLDELGVQKGAAAAEGLGIALDRPASEPHADVVNRFRAFSELARRR